MILQNWSDIVTSTLTEIGQRIITFIPSLLGAIVILIVGWAVAELLSWVVDKLLRVVRLQDLFKAAKVDELLRRGNTKLDTTGLLASLVKWVILLVSFIAAADTLGLTQVQRFLDNVLGYVPSVIAAGAILLLGAIFAHFMANVVKGSVAVAKLGFGELVGNATKYAILVFTILAALDQLGIASAFIQTLFMGFVALLAIAGGLAFGLGGTKVAQEWLEKFKKELQG